MKGVRINHSFVKDHSVSFCFFDRFQGFGVGISFDLVGIVYRDDSGFIEGYSDFVYGVGFEKVKVQLTLSLRIEGESAYLTLHFPLVSLVPVILGASSSKFDDVVAGFEFAGEFSKMISQGQHGLTGSMREDDGIGIEVQQLFGLELTESFSVEFESGPARGEAGHETIDVDLDSLFLVHALVDHFDHLIICDA